MPDNDCPINGINCVSITRVEALERALESEKESRSRAHEKIYDRLGELEEAVAMGITDGTDPMGLIPRYQAAIMAKRAVQKGKVST